MATSAADWKTQILDEIGAELPDVKPAIDKVKPNIDTIWEMWGAKASIAPYLQYLYARITALDRIIGQFRNLTNATLGVLNPQLGQKVDRMASLLRRNFVEDLERWEAQLASRRGGVIGLITKTTIREPLAGNPDPSDPLYRGDALGSTYPYYDRR